MPINTDKEFFAILRKDQLNSHQIRNAIAYISEMENPDIADNNGYTPLLFASFNGHQELVSSLIDQGANLNVQDEFGNNSLMYAVLNGHRDIVKLLIKEGLDVNTTNNLGQTALDLTKDPEILFLLKAKRLGVDKPFDQNWLVKPNDILSDEGVCYGLVIESTRWFMKHIQDGKNEEKLEIVSKFNNIIKSFKEKNNTNAVRRIALYQSEQGNINESISNLLIHHEYQKDNFLASLPDEIKGKKFIGFAFDAFDNDGNNRGGHIISIRRIGDKERYEVLDPNFGIIKCSNNKELNDSIEAILSNYQNNADDRQTAVFYDLEGIVKARNWEHEPILDDDTQEKKDNKKLRNKLKKYELELPLLHAIKSDSSIEYIQSLINKETIKEKDLEGKSPLHYGLMKKNSKIVKLLINEGIKLDVQDNNGNTVLHSEVNDGKVNTAKFLINKGADINIQNNEGHTPLILAISQGNNIIAEYLVDKGADINITDKEGKTAIDYARGNKEMTKTLMKSILSKHIDIKKDLISSGGITNIENVEKFYPPMPPELLAYNRSKSKDSKNRNI